MGSFYSVIRYLPNSLSEEFINFGVVSFEGTHVQAHFVRDWDRLRRFGSRDVGFARDFARRIERACDATDAGTRLDEAEIRRMADSHWRAIQFSRPAGSVLDVEQLLADSVQTYLPEPKGARPKPRGRHAAFKIAADALSDALRVRGGDSALEHLLTFHNLDGKHLPYKFAAVVSNGIPRAAVDAFSFEIQIGETLLKNIRAAAYSYKDVKEESPHLNVAVMMLEPPLANLDYDKAVEILRDTGSTVITEGEVYDWADEMAGMVLTTH